MAGQPYTATCSFPEMCRRRAWGPDFDKLNAAVREPWPRDVLVEAIPLAHEIMKGKVVAMLDGRPAAERFWAALYARLNGAEERARFVGEFVLILEIVNATRGLTIILNQPADAPAFADAPSSVGVPAETVPIVIAPAAGEPTPTPIAVDEQAQALSEFLAGEPDEDVHGETDEDDLGPPTQAVSNCID